METPAEATERRPAQCAARWRPFLAYMGKIESNIGVMILIYRDAGFNFIREQGIIF